MRGSSRKKTAAKDEPITELPARKPSAPVDGAAPKIVIADLVETTALTMVGNLACPFCGSTHLSRVRPRNDKGHGWIECETCGATGPNQTLEMAEVHWNTRAFGSEIYIRHVDALRVAPVRTTNRRRNE